MVSRGVIVAAVALVMSVVAPINAEPGFFKGGCRQGVKHVPHYTTLYQKVSPSFRSFVRLRSLLASGPREFCLERLFTLEIGRWSCNSSHIRVLFKTLPSSQHALPCLMYIVLEFCLTLISIMAKLPVVLRIQWTISLSNYGSCLLKCFIN